MNKHIKFSHFWFELILDSKKNVNHRQYSGEKIFKENGGFPKYDYYTKSGNNQKWQ